MHHPLNMFTRDHLLLRGPPKPSKLRLLFFLSSSSSSWIFFLVQWFHRTCWFIQFYSQKIIKSNPLDFSFILSRFPLPLPLFFDFTNQEIKIQKKNSKKKFTKKKIVPSYYFYCVILHIIIIIITATNVIYSI